MNLEQFKSLSHSYYPRLEAISNQLHNPTQNRIPDFIISTLRSLGLIAETLDATRLIVCNIGGNSDLETIGLWVDINNLTHTAIGLGVLGLSSQINEHLANNLRVIFLNTSQSSSSSTGQIEDHLDDISNLWILVDNESLQAGNLGIKVGPVFTCSGQFSITIAREESPADVASVASQIVTALRQLTNRKIDPLKPSEIQVTSMQSFSSYSLNPESVDIKGSYRTCDPEVAEKIPGLIRNSAQGFANAYQVSYTFEINNHINTSYNDRFSSRQFLDSGKEILGSDRVLSIEYPLMISKNLSRVLQSTPTCIVEMGTGNISKGGSALTNDGSSSINSLLLSCCSALCWSFLRSPKKSIAY